MRKKSLTKVEAEDVADLCLDILTLAQDKMRTGTVSKKERAKYTQLVVKAQKVLNIIASSPESLDLKALLPIAREALFIMYRMYFSGFNPEGGSEA